MSLSVNSLDCIQILINESNVLPVSLFLDDVDSLFIKLNSLSTQAVDDGISRLNWNKYFTAGNELENSGREKSWLKSEQHNAPLCLLNIKQ